MLLGDVEQRISWVSDVDIGTVDMLRSDCHFSILREEYQDPPRASGMQQPSVNSERLFLLEEPEKKTEDTC